MRLLFSAFVVAATPFLPIAAGEFKPEPGFTLIFNGKNLDGWQTLAVGKNKATPLEGKTDAFKGRFKVKDGELIIDPAVKGDVRIETVKEFAGNVTIRFEFQPDDNCNNDLFFRGQKFDLSKANVKNIQFGEWNPIEITVQDGKITFRVNGSVLHSTTTKVEKSTFGIRAELGGIQIRNLRASNK